MQKFDPEDDAIRRLEGFLFISEKHIVDGNILDARIIFEMSQKAKYQEGATFPNISSW